MTKVYTSAVVDAPIDSVWARIRDFNAMPHWHPGFSRSHIEDGLPSDRIGCVRNFDIRDGGGTIRERLLALSDSEYTFTYTILESPLPVRDYVATCRLLPITVGGRTLGVWTAEFEVVSGSEEEMLDRIGNRTFGAAFDALNEHFSRRA